MRRLHSSTTRGLWDNSRDWTRLHAVTGGQIPSLLSSWTSGESLVYDYRVLLSQPSNQKKSFLNNLGSKMEFAHGNYSLVIEVEVECGPDTAEVEEGQKAGEGW